MDDPVKNWIIFMLLAIGALICYPGISANLKTTKTTEEIRIESQTNSNLAHKLGESVSIDLSMAEVIQRIGVAESRDSVRTKEMTYEVWSYADKHLTLTFVNGRVYTIVTT